MSKYKISYDGWSEDASPIKADVKIKVSHNKLVSQKQNALARGEWGRKNPTKSKKIVVSGGHKTLELGTGIHCLSHEEMSEHGKKNYREGKGFAKLTKKERSTIGKTYGKLNLVTEIICEKCGRKTNKGNYSLSHGKNCKELKKVKFINLLPSKFTKKEAKVIAEEYEMDNIFKMVFSNDSPYLIVYAKIAGGNQNGISLYKKNIKEINKVKKYIK